MTITETIIPLVDLKAQYRTIQREVGDAVARVMERGDFILGEDLSRFEEAFAAHCGVKHAIGCGSGTDAIHLACRALGLGPGDEVIMPAFTFVATALGITLSGARPVLVDVDPDTSLVDIAKVAEAITPSTRAILPVHLYGHCADMEPILDLARKHDLRVIEDACQAHGALDEGRRAGSMSDVGCFSFYPGKNLGAYGDGGLMTVNDDALADKLRLLRNWGSRRKYHHEEPGLNSRLDTLQAAILNVKLPHLDRWNGARRALAAEYTRLLSDLPGIELTRYREGAIYHLYVVRLEGRDAALGALQEAGIQAGIHYPFAVHEHRAYQWLGYPAGAFPVSERWARRCLTLPIYAEMPAEAIPRAVHVLARVGRA